MAYLGGRQCGRARDRAERPQRAYSVLIVFVSALIAYATIMLVMAGLREHRQS